jgi:hypothetical protein
MLTIIQKRRIVSPVLSTLRIYQAVQAPGPQDVHNRVQPGALGRVCVCCVGLCLRA